MPNRRPKIQKPPVLFNESQQLIAQLEAELGMPLLTYWSSANGSVWKSTSSGRTTGS